LEKIAAAVNLNFATILRFELRNFLGNVALQQVRIVPVGRV